MKKSLFVLPFMLLLIYCNNAGKPEQSQAKPAIQVSKDSILFSFVFVGCNRLDHKDVAKQQPYDGSTANRAVLKWIFDQVMQLPHKPEQFFFLGDIVLGETDTTTLDGQLKAWVNLYQDKGFSNFQNSGIEFIAIPGNHEMLYAGQHHKEWPLNGATDVWMKSMGGFMPKDRDQVPDKSGNSRMTFAFKRHNVGFIVMNTDTYNEPTAQNPNGLEGIVDTQWIVDKVKQYRADKSIEHIFVLGHKPCYVDNQLETGHDGLPEGPILWPVLTQSHVCAMLSAHVHDYQRMQPGNTGTYQIIAGNGGSSGQAAFYGFTLINVLKNGNIELKSIGFDKGNPYYTVPANAEAVVQDSSILTWSTNSNPYFGISK
jgi:hypothetical protein